MLSKGLFIVFEGVDGCGKSTQIKNLQNYIGTEYSYLFEGVSVGCEPTDQESGKFIRRVLSKEIEINNLDVISGLFLSDRAVHQKDISDAINVLNKVYICDRYYYSNAAYNSKSLDDISYIEGLNSSFIKPDLCFYIDTGIDICIERINNRDHKDIFENSIFLKNVKDKYDLMCNQGKMIRINGNQSEEEVFQEIVKYLNAFLKISYPLV